MAYTVAVLGASPKPERYSNKAVKMLLDYGHEVLPIHPQAAEIHAIPCLKSLKSLKNLRNLKNLAEQPLHTLTLYVGADVSRKLADDIIALQPQRVIMNPGSENPELAIILQQQGISVICACTLVMLQTGQF